MTTVLTDLGFAFLAVFLVGVIVAVALVLGVAIKALWKALRD